MLPSDAAIFRIAFSISAGFVSAFLLSRVLSSETPHLLIVSAGGIAGALMGCFLADVARIAPALETLKKKG